MSALYQKRTLADPHSRKNFCAEEIKGMLGELAQAMKLALEPSSC